MFIIVTVTSHKPVIRVCVECHENFIAPVQNKSCEMPDGSLVRRSDYIDKCPICDDNFFGITWNLYYMEGLAMYQSQYSYVKPYTIEL